MQVKKTKHSRLLDSLVLPTSIFIVVDDFGVKYVGKQHAHHLMNTLKGVYHEISEDWEAEYRWDMLI